MMLAQAAAAIPNPPIDWHALLPEILIAVTAFVVLVLVLMLRPTGILGESLQRARA